VWVWFFRHQIVERGRSDSTLTVWRPGAPAHLRNPHSQRDLKHVLSCATRLLTYVSPVAGGRRPSAHITVMPQPARSLRHEYELYVEREIEAYKESVPRSVLLGIGDEAVRSLGEQPQFALTEMILWEEVDRIIARRIRLPAYAAWRRRRLRRLAAYRRPEHWGLSPDAPLMREVRDFTDGNVLLSAPRTEGSAHY